MVRTGATFADATDEYLRYVRDDRGRQPSTRALPMAPDVAPRSLPVSAAA